MEWIPVSEKLPKPGEEVLVLAKSGWKQVMYLSAKSGYWYPGGCPVCNTSHWMPLPEKPKDFIEWS